MKKRVKVNYTPGSKNDREQKYSNGQLILKDAKWTNSNMNDTLKMSGSSEIDNPGCTKDVRMEEENGIDSMYLRLRTLEEQVGSIINNMNNS